MFTRLTQSSADKEVSDTVEGMITRFEALLQMPKLDTNKELDIKIESPQSDADYGEKFAATSNRDLSNISIHQNEPIVNTQNQKNH